MKKILWFFILGAFAINHSFTQAPQGIPYQGLARNADGTVISNQAISVRLSVIDDSPEGTVVYIETHSTSTNVNGIFSLTLGKGTPQNSTIFSNINWANGSKFLKDEIDIGSGYVTLGTMQMMSVPYALYAANAGNSGPPANNSFVIPFACGDGMRVRMDSDGTKGLSLIGFGNSSQDVLTTNGQVDMSQNYGRGISYAFIMPKDGIITSMAASLTITLPFSHPDGVTITVSVRVYQASLASNIFTPIPNAVVNLSPTVSGTATVGTILSGNSSGLNIPVSANTKLMIVYIGYITGTFNTSQYVSGRASGGIGFN